MKLKLLASGLMLMMALTAAGEKENLKPSVSNERYTVTLIGERKAETTPGNAFLFEILDKRSGKTKLFPLEGVGVRPLKEFIVELKFARGDKLFIIIRWKPKPVAATIHLVDLEEATLIDKICGYRPSVSPSGRFCVYDMWYPPHGVRGVSTVVLVYDTKRRPDENRLGRHSWPAFVGIPIYPERNVREKKYLFWEQQFWSEEQCYFLSSPFLWSEDERNVVFLCDHGGRTYIVRVDLSEGIEKPRIFERVIQVREEFVKPEYLGEFRAGLLRNERFARVLHAEGLEWDGPDHVIVKVSGALYHLKERIRLQVP